MKYKNNIPMNENLRVRLCPRCDNEEFIEDATYCRICGEKLHNMCEGEYDGWAQEHIEHRNHGNSRYCETCGKPTYFMQQGYLDSWENENPSNGKHCTNKVSRGQVVNLNDYIPDDDEELPF